MVALHPDDVMVRKHRAPKGALRLDSCVWDEAADVLVSESTERQKVH